MAALDFPNSPSNGDEFSGYVYDSAKGVWNRLPTLPALDLVAFSATAPSNPQDGQFWFDTTSSKMYVYYNDGSSSQWVSTIGGFNELNAIDDVVISSATAGQALTYDGTNWVNGGGLVAVKSALKTDTFSASVAAGGNTAVTDLSITHALSNASNKLLITAFFGVASSTNETSRVGIAINDGSGLLALGDTAGTRTSVTAGGNYQTTAAGINTASPSISILYSPGTTDSKTYNVHIINTNSGTSTLYVNRTSDDSDNVNRVRGASSIIIQEVAA